MGTPSQIREEALPTSYEFYDFSLKEVVKVAIGTITVVWNGYQLTTSHNTLNPIPLVLALFANTYSLSEKVYPPLKGARPVFATSPLELYHIAHVASGIFNAIALTQFPTCGAFSLALLTWNTFTSRIALHIENSICGSLLAYRKSLRSAVY